jgi:hypothetical protein
MADDTSTIAPAARTDADVRLKSASAIAFAPSGVLLVGDGLGGSVYAFETGDAGPHTTKSVAIEDLTGQIAAMIGTTADQVRIPDIAVNPASGRVYVAVARGAGADADYLIVRTTETGGLEELDLTATPFTRADLVDQPGEEQVDRRGNALRTDTITDLGYVAGKVVVAGLSNEEFASTLRVLPYPLGSAAQGAGIEIWHAAHGQFETNAPVRTFMAYDFDGKPELLASYTCTPLVRISVDALQPGGKVKGTTIAELGNMNRPLDMIAYRKDGRDHILMANSNRGLMKLDADNLGQWGQITERVEKTRGVPYETVMGLEGVRRLDKLTDTHAVAMIAANDVLSLQTIALP